MRPKSMILIGIALVCGLIASFGVNQVIEGRAAPSAAPETVKIVVALTDIDINESFNAENIKLEEWPKDRLMEGALTDPAELEGMYARVRLYPGEVILKPKLMDANTRDAAAITIPEGYRVCTVKVEVDGGNESLVQPGDRVDILMFLRKAQEVPLTGVRPVLRNVRVFAVNSEMERSEDKDGKMITAKTVSFLVLPKQAARLTLASRMGQLQLSLRHPDDDGKDEDATVTLESIFNDELVDEEKQEKVVEEPKDEKLVEFLESQQPVEPVDEVQYETTVIYPTGNTTFQWTDVNKLPVVVGDQAPASSPLEGDGGAGVGGLDVNTDADGTGSGASDEDIQEDLESLVGEG